MSVDLPALVATLSGTNLVIVSAVVLVDLDVGHGRDATLRRVGRLLVRMTG